MATLTITHTPAEGTLIEGTSRGDGTADILKAHRWRWSRNLGAWYVPRSRDTPPRRDLIETTADALRAAGHQVTTELEDARRTTAQIEADKTARQTDRADALAAKADKTRQAAQAAGEHARELAGRVPLGQPILTDHHSAGRMRRHYQQVNNATRAELDTDQAARTAEAKADAAAHTTAARYAPVTVGNRIADRAARLRKAERDGRASEADRLRDELDYWRDIRAEQVAAGQASDYGPDDIQPGDLVQVGRLWWIVGKVNRKSVRVGADDDVFRHTVAYYKITGHRRPEPTG